MQTNNNVPDNLKNRIVMFSYADIPNTSECTLTVNVPPSLEIDDSFKMAIEGVAILSLVFGAKYNMLEEDLTAYTYQQLESARNYYKQVAINEYKEPEPMSSQNPAESLLNSVVKDDPNPKTTTPPQIDRPIVSQPDQSKSNLWQKLRAKIILWGSKWLG